MGWGAVLQRIDAGRFYDLGSNVITFEKVNGTMRCSLAITGEMYFSGDKVQPVHLSEAELARFAGRYHSDELDATYTLSAEKGSTDGQGGRKAASHLRSRYPKRVLLQRLSRFGFPARR